MTTSTHQRLKLSALEIDPERQRSLNKSSPVFTTTWNWNLFGTVVVSKRADGSLMIIDGQHRVTRACALGFGDQVVTCLVYEGLTLQEEADLFLRFTEQRKAIGMHDRFRISLKAGRAPELEINEIVQRAGLRIGTGKSGTAISAVKALAYVHESCRNLPVTLEVVKEWANTDVRAFDGQTIRHIGEFLKRFPKANHFELARNLRSVAPAAFLAQLKAMSSATLPRQRAALVLLADVYNKGRRSGRLSLAEAA